jgi:hypothetical protein
VGGDRIEGRRGMAFDVVPEADLTMLGRTFGAPAAFSAPIIKCQNKRHCEDQGEVWFQGSVFLVAK